MSAGRRHRLGRLGLALCLTAAGCSTKTGADRIAADFVDAYFVEFDLPKARALASMGAARRLDRDIALLGSVREAAPIEQARARVYYEKDPQRREVRSDLVRFEFALDVRTSGAPLTRTAVLAVALRDGNWSVIEFSDGSGETGAPPPVSVRTGTRTPGTGG